jgi:hypothetical protein
MRVLETSVHRCHVSFAAQFFPSGLHKTPLWSGLQLGAHGYTSGGRPVGAGRGTDAHAMRPQACRLPAWPLDLTTPGPCLLAPRFDKLLEPLEVARDAA